MRVSVPLSDHIYWGESMIGPIYKLFLTTPQSQLFRGSRVNRPNCLTAQDPATL